jgi:hypothetical protein
LGAEGLSDFSGGLSLLPPQELALNEAAMAKNVVFSARGGMNSRPGFKPFASEPLTNNDLVSIMKHVHYRDADGVFQLFGIDDTNVLHWTAGGRWNSTGLSVGALHAVTTESMPLGVNAAQYLDKSYFVQVFNDWNYVWNGYTMTALSMLYNEDLADVGAVVPSIPNGRVIAVKGDFTFVGDISPEGAGTEFLQSFPGRLRWSHPGIPTSWREQDFVDLPSGRITALVPFRDYLAIFTDDAIYGLYGDSTETFQVQAITEDTGTPYHWCVAKSASVMFWWDWDQGVMAMGAGAPKSIMGKIKPFFDAGGFDPDGGANYPPNLVWGDGKLYVVTGAYNDRVSTSADLGRILVFDPNVGGGAWTSFEKTNGWNANTGGTTYPRTFATDLVVIGGAKNETVVNDQTQRLDRTLDYTSNDKLPPVVTLRTAPFAGDTNATRKRFRRPRATLRTASARQRVKFGYLRDYSESAIPTFHELDLNFLSKVNLVDGGLFAVDYWQDLFGSEDTARWDGWSGTVHVVSNALNLDVTNVSGDKVLNTDATYDMRDVRASVNLTQLAANSVASFLIFDGNENMRFDVTAAGQITASWRDAASVTTVVGAATWATDKWLRFETSTEDGTVSWWTSADGIAWTNRATLDMPFSGPMLQWKIELRASQTTSGSATTIFDTVTFEPGPDVDVAVWDQSDWATDLNGNPPPDNFIDFRTLPSGGAGHAFQLEFRSVDPDNGEGISDATTNAPWGIDSIVIPFREKGIR